MRAASTLIILLCLLLCIPNPVHGSSNAYLDESTGIPMSWEYTETPPKRPQPKLLNSEAYKVFWKQDNPLMFSLIIDQNDVLYTSDSDKTVQATYPNGKIKWRAQLNTDSVINLLLGQDGTLYAYTVKDVSNNKTDTAIFALSPNGEEKWVLHSDLLRSRFNNHFAGDSFGNFYYFSNEGLVSQNAKGQVNWVNTDFTKSSHLPKLYTDSKGNLYLDSAKKEIISLDRAGEIRWRSQPQKYLDEYSVFQPFFSENGKLYMLTVDGLHGLNAEDGSTLNLTAQSDIADIRSSGIPTDGKGGYYINNRAELQKINSKGNLIWQYNQRKTETYGISYSTEIETDAIGNVYFSTGVGNVIGLNSEGQEIFAFLRNAYWYKSTNIQVGKNGNIYSAQLDIGLVAFGPKAIQVYADNQYLPMSVAPVNKNGTVLVPFRSLFESMGLSIEWDPAAKSITGSKTGLVIKLTIGEKTAYVNGQAKQLTVAPQIEKGSTYVPLRFVGEALGKTVSWDGKSASVNIDSKA